MNCGDQNASVPVIDRRRFLQKLEGAAMAAVLGTRGTLPMLLAACGGVRYASASRIGTQLVFPLKELGSEGSALVEVADGDLPIYVRRFADGRLSAVSTRCMHKGCQVEPSNDRLVCPCHGSEYTFEGGVVKGPTELPLARYRVTADEERVYIHLDSMLQPKVGS